ncbi:MAG: type II toxin-antitoxin system RelE/ParE family toxin [Candidatus Nomurabacteria bacterium]|nr:MAG: type II toxin-antitoxin system RelE/ParE family toxin [Candidatus Nomurabacteria bacterium]HRV75922.1 type II toxin-antitoxin system RelE/ParE family toxin [Candidatus Saccharimonadales bacterium]
MNQTFKVEVHHCTSSSKAPFTEALAQFEGVSVELRDKVLKGLEKLQYRFNWGKSGFTEYIAKGVYCMRIIHKNTIARVFFTMIKGKIYLLNGFVKKTQQMPKREIEKAIYHMKEVHYA